MRIIFDHQIFSLQRYGGVSRYFCEISKNIKCFDHVTTNIVAPLYVNEYLEKINSNSVLGMQIRQIPRSARIIISINNILSAILFKFYRNVDIFHETYYTRADNCPSLSKRIVTVYDMIHEKFPESFRANDKTREAKAVAVHRADHVICISESTRNDLIDLLGVPREKTSVTYLGYSLSVDTPAAIPSVIVKPYLLYVGQRAGYKNFEGLLRAYSASAALSTEFDLVCFGGGDLTAREFSLADELKLPRNSIHLVTGDDSILAGLYVHATVFVYPSLYEGFGIPPLEAMSFGCPVACANTSSLPEVVGNAAELFDPLDVAAMSAAIESVALSSDRARELVARGRERLSHFSWEKCARDTLEVYKNVLRR